NNIGVLDRLRDDFAAARTHHAEALELQRAAGDRDASIVTLLNLALAAIRLDQRDEAARHLREALTLVRDLRARRSGAAALEVAVEFVDEAAVAARLLGAASGLRRAIALPADAWWGAMTTARGRALAQHLGTDSFTREHTTGESLRLEEALALAQDAVTTPHPAAPL